MDVPAVPFKDLSSNQPGESSARIFTRIKAARQVQAERFQKMKIYTNANMSSRHIRKFCEIDTESNQLLERAMEKFALSARAHSRILKISRTIADLEGSAAIRAPHIAEAIQYRTLDRRVMK
jgi:magnesium chelatase family protein